MRTKPLAELGFVLKSVATLTQTGRFWKDRVLRIRSFQNIAFCVWVATISKISFDSARGLVCTLVPLLYGMPYLCCWFDVLMGPGFSSRLPLSSPCLPLVLPLASDGGSGTTPTTQECHGAWKRWFCNSIYVANYQESKLWRQDPLLTLKKLETPGIAYSYLYRDTCKCTHQNQCCLKKFIVCLRNLWCF